MKKFVLLAVLVAAMPLTTMAQDDDLYFNPKQEAKKEAALREQRAKANAEGLKNKLQQDGYDARVIKTDEQIKGYNCWFRVIAASYDDKASAVQTRSTLSAKHPGAWLLFRK